MKMTTIEIDTDLLDMAEAEGKIDGIATIIEIYRNNDLKFGGTSRIDERWIKVLREAEATLTRIRENAHKS